MQKAVAKKVETVTLKDLAAELVDSHGLPKGQVNTMLTEMVGEPGQAPQEGLAHTHLRSRHLAGEEARGAHGSQPSDGRDHQDQGQQEDCLPGLEGPQGSRDVDLSG